MKHVINRANQILQQYGNDLDRITESLGLFVVYEKLNGRMREIYFRDSIVINEDISKREKRELIAHAIAHHLLHAGNHMAMQKRIYSFGNHHEKQANIFAACLLMPSDKFQKILKNRPRMDEIANYFQVTEELVRLRMMIWASYEKPKKVTRGKNELPRISSSIN